MHMRLDNIRPLVPHAKVGPPTNAFASEVPSDEGL